MQSNKDIRTSLTAVATMHDRNVALRHENQELKEICRELKEMGLLKDHIIKQLREAIHNATNQYALWRDTLNRPRHYRRTT